MHLLGNSRKKRNMLTLLILPVPFTFFNEVRPGQLMYTAVVLGSTQINLTMRGFDKAVWSLNSDISRGQMTVLGFPRAI